MGKNQLFPNRIIVKMHVLSGPFLVSRTGDAGWTERWGKVPNYMLI